MGSAKYAHDQVAEGGVSTLILLQDDEFELCATSGSLTFTQWRSKKAQTRELSLSLVPRDPSDVQLSEASVPLVITAPFTSRFKLTSVESSLIPLLRVGKVLTYEVQFVPPRKANDSDFEWANFQDQIVIQTRLAKLSIHLVALRETQSANDSSPDSFHPRMLPSIKAPSFKLFDQIERDALTGQSSRIFANSRHGVSVSGSSHPRKSLEKRLDSLDSQPLRQPTPAKQSRPSARPQSSDRRTSSPRILEPLMTTSSAKLSADVTCPSEAREIILRLRARRSSQASTLGNAQLKDAMEVAPPPCPESQLDAKVKAELDEFNALVKATKMSMAGEMNRAKQELDLYKSMLPPPPTREFLSVEQATALRPGVNRAQNPPPNQPKLSFKPSRLPSLPSCTESLTSNNALSPVEATQKASKSVKSTATRESDVQRTKPQQTHGSATFRKGTESVPVKGPQKPTQAPVSFKPISRSSGDSNGETKKGAVKPASVSSKTKLPAKRTKTLLAIIRYDDALLDFDDADPEIDDAPVVPDDLRVRQDEDEDDPMLTMKVPL